MDDQDLYWLAGLLEGEGSFLKPAPSQPKMSRIKIEMTDEDAIIRVTKLFEVNSYTTRLPRKDNWKIGFYVQVKGKRAVHIMQQIYPLMGERRRQQIENAVGKNLSIENTFDENLVLYWLAGLLEAEGSFLKGSPSSPNKIRLQIQMADKDVIDRVANIFGTKTRGPYRPSDDKPSFKSRYIALKGSSQAAELMRQLRPLMGQRRQAQIDAALASYIPDRDHGDNHPHAKLTTEKVREIKLRLASGEKLTHLAREFGVDPGLVWQIKAGRIWQHVT